MKKYILGLTMVSMLAAVNTEIAMEKKAMPKTSLSAKEVAELRKAVNDYKNNRSRAKQEKIINKYENNYPNDSFVKAKLAEIERFDNPTQPQVKKEPVTKQPITQQERIEMIQPGEANLRISNKSGNTIELSIRYSPKTIWQNSTEPIADGKIFVKSKETVSMYVPEAEQEALRIYVYDSKGRMQKGIDKFDRVKKGQVIDLIYDNNWQYRERAKEDGEYTRGSYVNHLYEIRNGKTLNHDDDIYTSPVSK
jgi:hypothetical protein